MHLNFFMLQIHVTEMIKKLTVLTHKPIIFLKHLTIISSMWAHGAQSEPVTVNSSKYIHSTSGILICPNMYLERPLFVSHLPFVEQ